MANSGDVCVQGKGELNKIYYYHITGNALLASVHENDTFIYIFLAFYDIWDSLYIFLFQVGAEVAL